MKAAQSCLFSNFYQNKILFFFLFFIWLLDGPPTGGVPWVCAHNAHWIIRPRWWGYFLPREPWFGLTLPTVSLHLANVKWGLQSSDLIHTLRWKPVGFCCLIHFSMTYNEIFWVNQSALINLRNVRKVNALCVAISDFLVIVTSKVYSDAPLMEAPEWSPSRVFIWTLSNSLKKKCDHTSNTL